LPELAEAETIRRDIDAVYRGHRIAAVEVSGLRSVRRHDDPASFVARVGGHRLTGTRRRGKFLLMDLDRGDVLVAHMGMSGQLIMAGHDEPLARHTHVRLVFDQGSDLRFVDPRTFGQMWVSTPVDGVVPELAHLGFEPLDDPDAAAKLAALVKRPTRLKPLLMDQTRIAGIGNMYADEVLWTARLHPERPAASLSAPEGRRLYEAMVAVLTAAIEHRGSSLADEQYRDLFGRIGQYQLRHKAYARQGRPCPRCNTPIERIRFGNRSSFYCPSCQL
jgi:formamidopyrimidine-DNA glycosylase